MTWLILSLLTALAVSGQDACMKKFFSGRTAVEMCVYPMIYSLPLFMAEAVLIPFPPIGPNFLWCFLVSIPLNGVSFVLHMKAIKISPLSLTVPYLAFTPVFMILTAWLVLDEMPGMAGIAGILIICCGGYILNIDPGKWRLFSPFLSVFRESGSRIMLFVAFLYSFGSVLGKKAILDSSPLFFALTFFALSNLILICFFCITGQIRLHTFRKDMRKGLAAGIFLFTHAICHGWAISMIQASYMISVKRLSVVFSVICGKLIFREENIAFRLSGAVLMLAGTVLITLRG